MSITCDEWKKMGQITVDIHYDDMLDFFVKDPEQRIIPYVGDRMFLKRGDGGARSGACGIVSTSVPNLWRRCVFWPVGEPVEFPDRSHETAKLPITDLDDEAVEYYELLKADGVPPADAVRLAVMDYSERRAAWRAFDETATGQGCEGGQAV